MRSASPAPWGETIARRAVIVAAVMLLAWVGAMGARARKIEEVTTPAGIKAWLVEERSIPLIALKFSFEGGGLQDPNGKEGLTSLMAAAMTEGAGAFDAAQFARRMADQGAQISISGGRDQIHGGLDALSKRFAPSAELLRLALAEPRFDADAVERVRAQRLADLEIAENEPRSIAFKGWYKAAFPGHPYGRPADGTLESVRRISVDDMKAQHKRLIARSTLKVIVVGDIGRAEAIAAIDRIFGGLPAEAKLERIARPAMQGALAPVVVIKEQPLATAAFGLAALDSGHADYPALQVLNHIMGSGDFDSTLMEEIRVKRGLAYSVQLSLIHDQAASVMLGGMATKNENMREALAVLRTILEATAANGPTPEQFENARKYLTGSYLLDFDTNAKLGSSLLRIWLEGKGPDFIDKRNAGIDRVTLADVKRVARDILKPDRLIVTVVGQPKL